MVFFVLTSAFSLFSFGSVIPILNILFETTEAVEYTTAPEFGLSTKAFLNYLNYQIYHFVQTNGTQRALMLICIFIVVMFFLKNIMRFAAYYFLSPIRNGVMRDLRNKIHNRLIQLPVGYFNEERKGNLLSKVTNDVAEIEWAIIGSLELIFRDPITIVLYLSTMVFMSWKLTVFVLLILPVSGLMISLVAKTLKKPAQQGTRKMGDVLSVIEESISGIRIIKAFTAEKQVDDKFKETNNQHFRLMNRVTRLQYLGSPSSEFFASLSLALLLWFGGKLILSGDDGMTGAFFITYIIIFSQLIQPAKAISEAFFRIKKGMVSVERINEVILAETEQYQEDKQSLSGFNQSIDFKDVSFSYTGEKQAIKNFNLTIQKGETVALVGASGSGKTTIANLIPRFFEVKNGAVTIDGTNLSDYSLQSLRKQMGIVTQESILFNDSIRNNIAFGTENASLEDIKQAAKIANALEFIEKLDQGFDTNIGDLGSKLSGGQRQRLSIARAVLKNPPILILDEATSALDTESEKLVQDAIIKLMQNRTSIVIAHRLSTIQHADKIVVMNEGEIVEVGKHEELLANKGMYQRLVELQTVN